ncbi:MAG: sel1 repeat family protein [Moraxellaceae bacterium]|nr:sel1 repeat family protein [Moraxellaceae bacterium]
MSAQFHLAWMHQEGMGVEQNYEQAVYWYEQSSDSGNIVATNNLADKYEHGLGVEQDLDRAFALYSMAAGQVIAADLSLGRMYLEGRGVEKNLELAKSHLEKVVMVK